VQRISFGSIYSGSFGSRGTHPDHLAKVHMAIFRVTIFGPYAERAGRPSAQVRALEEYR
jgi:hypothetical protein